MGLGNLRFINYGELRGAEHSQDVFGRRSQLVPVSPKVGHLFQLWFPLTFNLGFLLGHRAPRHSTLLLLTTVLISPHYLSFPSCEPFEPCRARDMDAAPSLPRGTGGLMLLRLCQPHAGKVKSHSSSPAVNHTRAFP